MKLLFRKVTAILRVGLVGVLLFAMAGCDRVAGGGGVVAPERAIAAPSQETSAVVGVAGIDVTGSYTYFETARARFTQILRRARPGDSWYVRAIGATSYSDEAALLTLRLPFAATEALNPFDRRAKLRQAQRDLQLGRLRTTAIQELEHWNLKTLPSGMRSRTDVYGFLAKAADLFSSAPNARHVIVMASDLVDNVRQRGAKIDLRGADVIVVFFQQGVDVVEMQRRRQRWEAELRRLGAGRATFLDASEGIAPALEALF